MVCRVACVVFEVGEIKENIRSNSELVSIVSKKFANDHNNALVIDNKIEEVLR